MSFQSTRPVKDATENYSHRSYANGWGVIGLGAVGVQDGCVLPLIPRRCTGAKSIPVGQTQFNQRTLVALRHPDDWWSFGELNHLSQAFDLCNRRLSQAGIDRDCSATFLLTAKQVSRFDRNTQLFF